MAGSLLLRTAEDERVVVDPLDVYLLEADGGSTRVRRASATELVDIRELGEVAPLFERRGFVQVHRQFVVNPDRVAVVRRRDAGRDWEVKMAPPVNRVIPVARDRLDHLWAAFAEDG